MAFIDRSSDARSILSLTNREARWEKIMAAPSDAAHDTALLFIHIFYRNNSKIIKNIATIVSVGQLLTFFYKKTSCRVVCRREKEEISTALQQVGRLAADGNGNSQVGSQFFYFYSTTHENVYLKYLFSCPSISTISGATRWTIYNVISVYLCAKWQDYTVFIIPLLPQSYDPRD